MTYEEMIAKAKIYQEMMDIKAKRPQLIAESRKAIAQLQNEIVALEEEQTKEALNPLAPKRFFWKKLATSPAEQIRVKEEEIQTHERKIEIYSEARLEGLVDLLGIKEEANKILSEQESVLHDLERKIAVAREAYHSVLDEYEETYLIAQNFQRTISKNIEHIRREGRDILETIGNKHLVGWSLNDISPSIEVIEKHRGRPIPRAHGFNSFIN